MKEVQVAFEKNIPDRKITVKGKFNSQLDAAISVKHPIWKMQELGNVIWGVGISDAKESRKISYGMQVDLNL